MFSPAPTPHWRCSSGRCPCHQNINLTCLSFFLCLFKVPLAALITYIIKKDWHCPTSLGATTDTFVCGDQRSTTATRPGQATTSPGQTTALWWAWWQAGRASSQTSGEIQSRDSERTSISLQSMLRTWWRLVCDGSYYSNFKTPFSKVALTLPAWLIGWLLCILNYNNTNAPFSKHALILPALIMNVPSSRAKQCKCTLLQVCTHTACTEWMSYEW